VSELYCSESVTTKLQINVNWAGGIENLSHWFWQSVTGRQDDQTYISLNLIGSPHIILHWLYLVVKYYNDISSNIVFDHSYNWNGTILHWKKLRAVLLIHLSESFSDNCGVNSIFLSVHISKTEIHKLTRIFGIRMIKKNYVFIYL
jgi:hypothetical protein